MSDVLVEKQSSTEAAAVEESPQKVAGEVGKLDGESAPPTSTTGSGGDITEEEENKLLADDDDDLDVIDCYTEDFDSDMENDFCRKEASKEKERKGKAKVAAGETRETAQEVRNVEKDEKKAKEVEKQPEEPAVDSPAKGDGKPLIDDDDDEDIIRIDDDISDMFLEPDVTKPEISLCVKNETEKTRILSEPLVKQIIVPEVCVSDDDDDRTTMGSQESLSLQIDHFVEKASEIMEQAHGKRNTNEKKDAVLSSSGETSEAGMYGCHQEDPDLLRLKLDLYQEIGEMDYEKTDEDGEKNTSVRVKQEPTSPPLKERPDYSQSENIPTIELTSTDEDAEPPVQVKVEVPKFKKKRNKKSSSKKKTSSEHRELKPVSSEDSFLVVPESTVSERSIECRVRNDSEGSWDGVGERVKSLRNRKVTIVPEIMAINSATKKSRAVMKTLDKESKEPAKKKRKIDPAMQGYKRRKSSVCRSASKSSMVSVSTGTSSIPDEDIIVISAHEILNPDPLAIEGRMLNIENECEQEGKSTEEAESKEQLLNSLDLKEAIAKELEHEETLSDDGPKKESEAEESSFPVPTTDIALEDMLDAWIEDEPAAGSDPDIVFHSISPEEKFLMDSLFADCEKQAQQLPSLEHLESLMTIMDDGKPLVERSAEEPIPLCYTICDGTGGKPEIVPMQPDASDTSAAVAATGEPARDANLVKLPHIKIIQNYQKYPFQEKPAKKQPKSNPKRRGRKRLVTMGESDEEYRPPCSRKRKRRVVNKKPQPGKPASMQSKTEVVKLTEKPISNKAVEPPPNDEKQQVDDAHQEEPKSDVETATSSVCMHMPTLEEDLALTTSSDDDSSTSLVADKNGGDSKEQLGTSPPKKGSTIRPEGTSKDKGPMMAKSSGLKLVLSALRKRGRPKVIKPGYSTNQDSSLAETPSASCSAKGKTRRTGRKSKNPDSKPRTAEREENATPTASSLQKQSTSQQSLCATLGHEVKKSTKKPVKRRKRRALFSSSSSSSSEEEETASISNSATTETEPERLLSMSPLPSETDQAAATENAVEATKELNDTQPVADKMDNLQIVISPLTVEKIRMINTPQKKPKTFTKASQTEIYGMTWSVDLDQINFHSEYFNQLRTLLVNGANQSATRAASNKRAPMRVTIGCEPSFRDVDIPSRSALHHLMNSPPVQQQPSKPTANGSNRTYADMLLFERDVNELEHNTSSNAEDPLTRQKLEQDVNTVRSTFRIPKLSKKPSTSPQVVTSSTPHVVNSQPDHHDRPAAGAGAGALKRVAINDYVDDQGEHSNDGSDTSHDRQELRQQIIMQERFVPPVSRQMSQDPDPLALSRADNVPPVGGGGGQAVSNPVPQPGPSSSAVEKRNIFSNLRTEGIKRTIQNDMVQPPLHGLQQPPVPQAYGVPEENMYNPPQQPPLPSFSVFGGFQPSFVGGNLSSFNRGLMPGYSGMGIPQMFNSGMLGMQGMQQPRENNVNNLLAMLLEQCCQQQMNQPAMAAPVAPMVPNQNAPGQLPGLGQLFPQMNLPPAVQQLEPQRATNEQVDVINLTFGCIDFLTSKCLRTHCRYPHVVPSEEEVLQKLSMQNRNSIMVVYKFVASRDDLFNKYFPVFARVMGSNNMRHQLVSTIADCEQPKRPFQYYRCIVEGLKMSGTSSVQAVQILLEKHTKKNFHQINVLIELILDTGEAIPTFLRWLEDFFNVRDYRFPIEAINRLLEFCNRVELPTNELAVFVSKLILNVRNGEEHLVSVAALIVFTGKVRLDPELAMNVEYIIRKYGKIEVPS